MQDSLRQKLNLIVKRQDELAALLSDAKVINDQNRYRELSKEYADKGELVSSFKEFVAKEAALLETKTLLEAEIDSDLKTMAEDELKSLQSAKDTLEEKIKVLLLPKDPNDTRNIFLEIRAGAGGSEASIFAGDLFRMYSYYAEAQGWRVEVVSMSQSEQGGFKEVIARVIGEGVYGKLKFEAGVHRVQRVPETEAQGRVHTSTCTVAVLPEVEEIEHVAINPVDLKIDTYRSSGAGGQHVNVTDSAVRITHLPSGVVVECQDERSQHKNRARAMSLLQSRLLAAERAKQQQEEASNRRSMVGTGDRSERIRTYNFPQSRLTDHRIGLTIHSLDQVMEGKLDEVIDSLLREHQAELLSEAS